MLSREDNEMLTRVGPRTPIGRPPGSSCRAASLLLRSAAALPAALFGAPRLLLLSAP
jgi:hypothetical protein